VVVMDDHSGGPFSDPSTPPAPAAEDAAAPDDAAARAEGHPVSVCAGAIESALKGVADVDPVFMTTAEKCLALESLTQLAGRVEALRMRVIAAADEVAEAVGSGMWAR